MGIDLEVVFPLKQALRRRDISVRVAGELEMDRRKWRMDVNECVLNAALMRFPALSISLKNGMDVIWRRARQLGRSRGKQVEDVGPCS